MESFDRLRLSAHAFRVSAANPRLRLVQAARLASVTGRWAYTITLAVFAYREGGAAGVAVAGIVRLAPAAAAAPLAGALFRRARIDRLLLGGGLARTLALAGAGLLVLAGAPAWCVYTLVALESVVSTLMRPLQNAILPILSQTPEELTSTNLALSVIESAGVFVGPLIGAALLHGTSVGVVFLAAAAAYLVSAILLAPVRVPAEAGIDKPASATSFSADVVAGARSVMGDPNSRVVVFLYGAQNLVAGALNVLIVVTALDVLDLGQSGVGALTAAVGIGGVVGGILVFTRLRQSRHGADLALGLLLWGAPLVLLALVSSQVAAFLLLGVVGLGVTVVDVAAVTLLQRTAKGELLPHVLGLLQAVFVTSVAVGTLIAPVLVSWLGPRGALLATGLVLPALALALWRRLQQLDARPAAESSRARLLRGLPIFAPLQESALEQLADSLRRVLLSSGATVFAEGDDGDGFYLIEQGSIDVSIDGNHIRSLGAGESFGEIALLRNIPRTATITAKTAVALWRLERAPFLATVTGNTASTSAADALIGTRLGPRSGLSSI
jgi:hypothetical protein